MAEIRVNDANAIAVRRPIGTNVTIINQSAVDVYFDTDPNRLNASLTGAVPSGTKLANGGGEVQYSSWPGIVWFRAASITTIEVSP